jgi:hypothetical protein
MTVNLRDLTAGIAFVVVGAAFGANAWLTLRIGEAYAMGPGYFPVLLGLVLVGFGAAIVFSAVGKPREAFGPVAWRGAALITLAIVFFALTVRGLGMAPALGVATTVAALASGRLPLAGALLLAAGLTAFCVVVFLYALQLPYPVIGPWLRG